MLDLLGLYSSQDAMLKGFDAAEETEFDGGEPSFVFQFYFQQSQCAYQIGDLEQLVSPWGHGLRELNARIAEVIEALAKELRYRWLPAIVVHLDFGKSANG